MASMIGAARCPLRRMAFITKPVDFDLLKVRLQRLPIGPVDARRQGIRPANPETLERSRLGCVVAVAIDDHRSPPFGFADGSPHARWRARPRFILSWDDGLDPLLKESMTRGTRGLASTGAAIATYEGTADASTRPQQATARGGPREEVEARPRRMGA
jgi:hypothetical protein